MPCTCGSTIGAIQTQNFICVAGDDFYETMTVIDELTGQPVDISLWSWFLDIFSSWSAKIAGDQPLISLVNGNGFTLVSGVLGRVDMSIGSMATGAIPVGLDMPYGNDIPENSCVYDLVALDGNGLQRTRLRGSFTFQLRLTPT